MNCEDLSNIEISAPILAAYEDCTPGNFLVSTMNYKLDAPECFIIYSTTPMETAESWDLFCVIGTMALWILSFIFVLNE